jgi:hypothetical protein
VGAARQEGPGPAACGAAGVRCARLVHLALRGGRPVHEVRPVDRTHGPPDGPGPDQALPGGGGTGKRGGGRCGRRRWPMRCLIAPPLPAAQGWCEPCGWRLAAGGWRRRRRSAQPASCAPPSNPLGGSSCPHLAHEVIHQPRLAGNHTRERAHARARCAPGACRVHSAAKRAAYVMVASRLDFFAYLRTWRHGRRAERVQGRSNNATIVIAGAQLAAGMQSPSQVPVDRSAPSCRNSTASTAFVKCK